MRELFPLLRETAQAFQDDRVSRKAAALAFYTVFSLAPLLIISIAIAGAFFGAEAARGEIVGQIRGLVGEEGARAIEGMLQNAGRPGSGTIAALTGFATLILGATTAFAELKEGLDQIWGAPRERVQGLLYTLLKRVLSFGVILSIGFLLLVSLVFSAAVAALQRYWHLDSSTSWVLQSLNFLLSFGMVTAMFAMIYKLLPSVKIAWRDVIVGALVTALLFNVGKFFIGLYLGQSAVASTYGAAGSVILLLLWVYYSALIFLFGAEFTKIYARRRGSHRHLSPAESAGAAANPTRA
jgi:membrane protein